MFHKSVNFRAHSCDFWGYVILEKNNLQTVQQWTKSYIELIALYVHQKNSNHLRSHLRAIMALDHCRLGFGKQIRPNFLRSTSSLYKILLTMQIWGRVTQPFCFLYITSEIKLLWGAVFIIQTSDGMQSFTIFAIQIALIQYSGRSRHA